jgi:sugar/nucleoside kinase (ribokinase family)
MLDLIVIGVINIHSILATSLKGGIVNPISEYSEKFSGSALHIALNASILEAQVGLIAPVGRDAVGLMDLLKRYSVDYSHIVLSSKKNPNIMELHTSHRHYDLYYEGAVSDLHFEKIEKEYLKKAKAVHLCFPDQKLTDNVAKTLRKEKAVTSVDARFSQTDADIVFTEEDGKGKNTMVMDFEKGIVCNGKEIPVFRGDEYHENGVKDAFIAAFLTRYVKSQHVMYSALYGSCAAFLCSLQKSAILTCTKEELDNLFDEKKDLHHM